MRKARTIFEAEIGDAGLKFEARVSAEGPALIVFLTRHGQDVSSVTDGAELRILGELMRLAGLEAINQGL